MQRRQTKNQRGARPWSRSLSSILGRPDASSTPPHAPCPLPSALWAGVCVCSGGRQAGTRAPRGRPPQPLPLRPCLDLQALARARRKASPPPEEQEDKSRPGPAPRASSEREKMPHGEGVAVAGHERQPPPSAPSSPFPELACSPPLGSLSVRSWAPQPVPTLPSLPASSKSLWAPKRIISGPSSAEPTDQGRGRGERPPLWPGGRWARQRSGDRGGGRTPGRARATQTEGRGGGSQGHVG